MLLHIGRVVGRGRPVFRSHVEFHHYCTYAHVVRTVYEKMGCRARRDRYDVKDRLECGV